MMTLGYHGRIQAITFLANRPSFKNFMALCKISNFTTFKTPLLSQFLSDSSKLYTMHHNHTRFTFWGISQNCKDYSILTYSLSRAICCYNFQSAISTHNFPCSPSKLYDNIDYHGKSKCLLEYEKLASST